MHRPTNSQTKSAATETSTKRSLLQKFSHYRLLLVCLVVLAMSPPLIAQVQNGDIVGDVLDPLGARVPDAAVTLTETATNVVLHGKTNSDGAYHFSQLIPGTYSVSVEKTGFRTESVPLTLTVGQSARVDVRLQIGKASETVVVNAGVTSLETQTSNLAYTVQTQQVEELPLNGNNPYGLAVLSPGIMPGDNFGVGVTVARGALVAASTNNFQSNGGIGGNNEVLVDGVSVVVCCQGQPAVTPTKEVVSQFQVVTSAPPAQYGRTSGATLNIATKTGTNQITGVVYEYLRNDKLDAANFFTKRSGVYPYAGKADFRAPHRANQFGAFVSGPVYLPFVYNGKNKTFFTFGYEGIRNLAPSQATATVPTALERQGIFTEAPIQIYNPYSSNSATVARTPVAAATCNGQAYGAGYCIPQSSWNPTATALAAFWPLPNQPGTTNNYVYSSTIVSHDDQYNFRIDHNFNDKNRSFMRGTKSTNEYTISDLFNKPNGPSGQAQTLKAYLFAVGHIWTVTPNLVLQFNYGFATQSNGQFSNSFFKYDAGNYGFSGNFTSEQQVIGLPSINVGSYVVPTTSGAFNDFEHYAHNFNASALLQWGRHSLNFGYSGKIILENNQSQTQTTGTFTYSSKFTGGPLPNAALPVGQSDFASWASFLLGVPASGSLTRSQTGAFQQMANSMYVQDDWRFNSKLTLNLGVRWDIETGFKERYNRWGDFDPNVRNPLSDYVGSTINGGARFLGVGANSNRTWQTLYGAVGPRVGFAYAATPTTVVRGAYGLIYLPQTQRYYLASPIGYTQRTSLPVTTTGFAPAVTADNPFPSGVLPALGAAGGVGTGSGTTISGLQYQTALAYQQQWNFGIQQQMTRVIMMQLGYVGGHGVKLPLTEQPNDLQPQYFGAVGDQSQVAYLQAAVTNPFYGAPGLASGTLTAKTVQRAQLLTAFPQYTSGTISGINNTSVHISGANQGSTTYNALQAGILARSGSDLVGSVNYTWSKSLGNVSDLTNGSLNGTGTPTYQDYYFIHQYEHSVLSNDITHRVAGTVSWALPVGKGKRFGSTMPAWADQIVGGWKLTTIVQVFSGFPMNFTVTGAAAFAGTRPSFTGQLTQTQGSLFNRLGRSGAYGSGYLNPAGFRLPQSFELGNVPRGTANVRGPFNFSDDASILKFFPIHGPIALELRGEAFNVLNKASFNLPARQVNGTDLGIITTQHNLPRNIQIGAKLHF